MAWTFDNEITYTVQYFLRDQSPTERKTLRVNVIDGYSTFADIPKIIATSTVGLSRVDEIIVYSIDCVGLVVDGVKK